MWPSTGDRPSQVRWRGEIDFEDERQWERFRNDYERWIAMLAAGTTDAGCAVDWLGGEKFP